MRPFLEWFFKSWLKHKWHVLVVGCKLGVPLWQLIVHDMSKLSVQERSYMRSWHGLEALSQEARFHHVRHNKHHWHCWVGLDMPHDYVAEMVADWIARCLVKGHWDLEQRLDELSGEMSWLTKCRVRAVLDRVRSIKWQ